MYTRCDDRFVYDKQNILLMRARGKLGHYAPVFLMDALRGNYIINYLALLNNGRRSLVTRRLNCQDSWIHVIRQ